MVGRVRLCDFGSAVDAESITRLYPAGGPSQAEGSREWAPPEVLFGALPFHAPDPRTYDMWSIGVLFLELLLGTHQVFRVDDRTRAIIETNFGTGSSSSPQLSWHSLLCLLPAPATAGEPEETREKAVLFRAFVEYDLRAPPPPPLSSPLSPALHPPGRQVLPVHARTRYGRGRSRPAQQRRSNCDRIPSPRRCRHGCRRRGRSSHNKSRGSSQRDGDKRFTAGPRCLTINPTHVA
jgi:serine/threonine protein kinase